MNNGERLVAENRRARFEYELLDKYEAGIVLTGDEIKSVRAGHLSLTDCYGFIKNNECFLRNGYIKEYTNSFNAGRMADETKRDRKLLLHRDEISKIKKKLETEHLTLVPTRAYFSDSNLKIELCIARGKKLFDKRESIKKKETERNLKRLSR